MRDRVCGGDEVQRRKDDFVTGPAAHGQQRQMERSRPVRDCERVARAAELSERGLEVRDLRPHAPPAGVEDLVDGRTQLVVD